MAKNKVRTAWIAEVRKTSQDKYGVELTILQAEELIRGNGPLHKEFVHYGVLDATGQECLTSALVEKGYKVNELASNDRNSDLRTCETARH